MDQKTVEYYTVNASQLYERYESVASPLRTLFPQFLGRGDKVLDVGCGSGRDVKTLLELGMDAYGLEPSPGFVERAQTDPILKERVFEGALPDRLPNIVSGGVPSPFDGLFDALLLSAVIMHIPDNALFDTAFALRALLKQGGKLLIVCGIFFRHIKRSI